MKRLHVDCAGLPDSGIYQIKVKRNKNLMEIWHNSDFDFYGLIRLVDKCAIESFEVSLEPLKSRK